MALAIIWLLLIAVAFYLLIARPQRRRMLQMRSLQAALEVGDEVITSAGIYGTVVGIDDATVDVQVAPDVTLKVARAAIAQLVSADEALALPPEDANEDGPSDTPPSDG